MAHQTTVAKPSVKSLKWNQIYDDDFDETDIIVKAIKLFLMAYPEAFADEEQNDSYEHEELFIAKRNQYLAVMAELYNIDVTNFEDYIDPIWQYCRKRNYRVVFAVKRFLGRDMARNLSLTVWDANEEDVIGTIMLDHKSEEQQFKCLSLECSFDDMKDMRRHNNIFLISVNAQQWRPSVANNPLNTLMIRFGHIHPEGYQQWFDFGRGVSLIIEITYRVIPIKDEDASNYHLQTLVKMLDRQLRRKIVPKTTRALPVDWSAHNPYTHTYNRTTCMRTEVEPNSSDMYWRQSQDMTLDLFRESFDRGTPRPRVRDAVERQVLYFELQRSLIYGEDIEENNVCLCNEWCSWTAFFHHNPIYRFMLIINGQLFIENHITRSCMYLLAGALYVLNDGIRTPHPRAGYVLSLIYSANQYHQMDWYQIRAHQKLTNLYLDAEPDAIKMVATTYRHLRYDTAAHHLCQQFDDNPLADICVQNLINYYKVIESLHHFVGQWIEFVNPLHYDDWRLEFNAISRAQVGVFLHSSYTKLLDTTRWTDPERGLNVLRVHARDKLFGSDAEYLDFYPKSDDEKLIKQIRICGLGSPDNVINMSVMVTRFIHCFISVYKFFARIEKHFTIVEHQSAKIDVNDYCIRFDQDFVARFRPEPQTKFIVSERDMNDSELPVHMQPNIAVFYTLKLYSFGWFIQNRCIKARSQVIFINVLNQRYFIADSFHFIFNHAVIEETLRNSINYSLFEIEDKVSVLFNDFYEFWGKPLHEMNNYDINVHPMTMFVGSANLQYYKLYVWSTNGGDARPKLTSIGAQFNVDLIRMYNRNVHIFDDNVIPVVQWLTIIRHYEYGEEVLDVLALYLCRAYCFILIEAVAKLFGLMHGLQNYEHCQDDVAFSMGKPGWLQLFQTIDNLANAFHELRALYINFEDEMERISQTVSESQQSVKQFCKHLYAKLSFEWIGELAGVTDFALNHNLTPDVLDICNDLMLLQLIVGLAFSARLANYLRYTFKIVRENMFTLFNVLSTSNMAHEFERFCLGIVPTRLYLSNPNAVRNARPFATNIWQNYLNNVFADIVILTPHHVALDMDEANRVITQQAAN